MVTVSSTSPQSSWSESESWLVTVAEVDGSVHVAVFSGPDVTMFSSTLKYSESEMFHSLSSLDRRGSAFPPGDG